MWRLIQIPPQPKLKSLFGVPDLLEISVLMLIGYTNQARAKDRRLLGEAMHVDRYDKSKM